MSGTTALERVLAALESRDVKMKRLPSGSWQGKCPRHDGKGNTSLGVAEGDDGRALLVCRGGCATPDVLASLGLEEKDLFPENEKRRPAKKAGPAIEHIYRSADGQPLAKKLRLEHAGGKSFAWKRRNGDGWTGGLAGLKPPLFRLPELLAAVKADETVHVTEGEKKADTLAALGFATTSAPGGAGDSLDAPGLLEPLRGADVILWPDEDEKGRQYVERFARKLASLARRVRTIAWPDGRPEKFDVADYIAGGAKREDLEALIGIAPESKAQAPENGAALLRDVRGFIRRFVVLTSEQEVAVTLWILHTWTIAAVEVTPYLYASSAVMRAGKTRLLETAERLVRNPWRVVQPSEAVLFRKLGQGDSTLLFDEVDAVFGKNVSDAQEGIRAVLNAGFQRGARIPRCIDRGREIEEFDVFCPKFLCGIGLPPPTVRDRSFVIEMKRKKRSENVSRFRRREAEALAAPIRERLERWAEAAVDSLRDARPELPDALGDRAQDAAEPLLAIADSAGAEWPALARKALVVLAGEGEGDDDELSVRLLADIRTIFGLLHRTDGDITTASLLSELHAREESPWRKLNRGEPLDAAGLARLLKFFGPRPRVIRQGETTVRGYLVSAFSDAFERYLPSGISGETGVTVKQTNTDAVETVSGDPKHDPKHASASPRVLGVSDSVTGGVTGGGETVSSNKDGPCVTVSDVSGGESNGAGEDEECGPDSAAKVIFGRYEDLGARLTLNAEGGADPDIPPGREEEAEAILAELRAGGHRETILSILRRRAAEQAEGGEGLVRRVIP